MTKIMETVPPAEAWKENKFSRSVCVNAHQFDVSIKKVEDA